MTWSGISRPASRSSAGDPAASIAPGRDQTRPTEPGSLGASRSGQEHHPYRDIAGRFASERRSSPTSGWDKTSCFLAACAGRSNSPKPAPHQPASHRPFRQRLEVSHSATRQRRGARPRPLSMASCASGGREIERRLVEPILKHGQERLALGRRAPQLRPVLKIGARDSPECAQTLDGVLLALLCRRPLFGRIMAVGDLLAQSLGPSASLGESDPDADLDRGAACPSLGRSTPTRARGRPGHTQAGHVAVNQLLAGPDFSTCIALSGATRFDILSLHRRSTL